MTLRDAFLLAKERRSNVGPNQHFFARLAELEDSLRPPESKGAPPSFSMKDFYTTELVSMGFDHAAAAAAVDRAEGRFELALNFCLAGA